VLKINQEFKSKLPTVGSSQQTDSEQNEIEDPELEQLLFEEQQESVIANSSIQDANVSSKVLKTSPVKPAKSQVYIRKVESQKQEKSEYKAIVTATESQSDKDEYMEMETSALYTEEDENEEEQLDDDGNIFGEEIYDIMEVENEGSDNIYLEESGKQALDDDGEFILVDFKSSTEDLDGKVEQFMVEEVYEKQDKKPSSGTRKKHVNRMPREIVEKYAQSTDTNQHICTKCMKVFSTRTNLIRHIQSHDGFKPYTCEICNKGEN
jgi:hypothetical protein